MNLLSSSSFVSFIRRVGLFLLFLSLAFSAVGNSPSLATPGQMKGNTFGTSDFATARSQTDSRF